jgi:hypothetical protein
MAGDDRGKGATDAATRQSRTVAEWRGREDAADAGAQRQRPAQRRHFGFRYWGAPERPRIERVRRPLHADHRAA